MVQAILVYFQHLSAARLHLSLILGNVENQRKTEDHELTHSMVLMLTLQVPI